MAVSAELRERMASLIGEGLSCNAVARELGVSPSTISRHAKLAGLSFDRTRTAKAVEAARIDAAGRRAEVGAGLLEDIGRARLKRLATAKDGREFAQVAQGIAALARGYRDLALLPEPADNAGAEEVKIALAGFLSLAIGANEERHPPGDELSPLVDAD